MARVHSSSSSSSSSSAPGAAMAASGQRREVFTVWMKSLVLNGRGCTVYDSGGRIVYRVDNYGSRSCRDVCLMDLHGGIVLNILKKKLAFGKWEGYKWSNDRKQQAWFTVARPPLFRRTSHQSSSSSPSSSSCEFENEHGHAVRYRIDGGEKRACCKIVDETTGVVVAEVKRKVTAGGVALGEDMLALVVEPGVDQSLIMGLVLVYGLMNRTM